MPDDNVTDAGESQQDSQDTSLDAGTTGGAGQETSVDAQIPAEAPDRTFEEMLADGANSRQENEGDADKPVETAPAPDPLLEQVAKDLNLPPEKIAAAKQAGLLPDLIAAFDRKLIGEVAEHRQAIQQQQQMQQQMQAQQQQQQQSPQPTSPAFQFNWKTKDEFGNEVEVNPTIRSNIEGLHGQIQNDIGQFRQDVVNAFQGMVLPLQQGFQEMAAMLVQERLNNQFSALGEEWADTFGKGPVDEMDPQSPQAANRRKLTDAAAAIINWEQSKGRQATLNGKVFQRALAAAFADQLTSKVRKQVSKESQQARGQRIHPPTQRHNTAGLTGFEKAQRAAAEGFAKYGLPDNDD